MTIKSSHYNNRNMINKFKMRKKKKKENKESMTNIIEHIIGNKKKRETLFIKNSK